ncbi:MAG: carbohydrate kinase family protein [Anaerolineales bacterium]
MKPFVTLGDLIADLYLGVDRLPVEAAQHQTVSHFDLGPGGAGNALVAAARLGLPTVALGSLGADWVGERVLHHLRAEGVDTSHVLQMNDAPTAAAVVLRAEAGGHVFLGRYGTHGPQALPARWTQVLQSAGIVFVDGWSYFHDEPAVIRAGAEMAARAGAPVLFDPGPQVAAIDSEWLKAMLRSAKVLLMTEEESSVLDRVGLRQSFALHDRRGLVCITKHGAAGCTIATGDSTIDCPGYAVEMRDTTAAGDCFAAAVGWGLLHGLPWNVIGAVANAAGAAKVQKLGTALAAPTREEVAAVLYAYRPELLPAFF